MFKLIEKQNKLYTCDAQRSAARSEPADILKEAGMESLKVKRGD